MGACEAGSNLPLIELAYTLIETSFCSGHSVVLPCFDLVNGVSVARIIPGRVSFENQFCTIGRRRPVGKAAPL